MWKQRYSAYVYSFYIRDSGDLMSLFSIIFCGCNTNVLSFLAFFGKYSKDNAVEVTTVLTLSSKSSKKTYSVKISIFAPVFRWDILKKARNPKAFSCVLAAEFLIQFCPTEFNLFWFLMSPSRSRGAKKRVSNSSEHWEAPGHPGDSLQGSRLLSFLMNILEWNLKDKVFLCVYV